MQLCERGKLIAKKCDNFITDKEGEPTKLYWHISECEECREIREQALSRGEVVRAEIITF